MPDTETENKTQAQDMNFKSREDRLKDLTDQLEEGVKSVRNSSEFKTLLATMAKFPHYSLNNCILIAMQKPDATLCQSYSAWKKMGRFVKKGEKGIKVIAPAPYTIEKEVDKRDASGKVVLDSDGEPVKEKQELNLMGFKAESTFDVSQTEGKELPKLGIDELKGDVNKFSILMDVIKEISPVPIGFEDIGSGAKGYYSLSEKRIAIQEGMSELQTLKTCLHEVVHAKLHADAGSNISKNRKEIEAEGSAAVILNFFGYDTGSYSFPYLASYTTDDSLKELKSALNTIRKTSASVIRSVEEKMRDAEKTHEQEAPVKDASDDWPLKDNEGEVVTDKSAAPANVGRKILGTVRILPDGDGGKRPSLLDKLRIEKEKLSRDKAAGGAANEKGGSDLMGNENDDGWMNAEDYDGYIPFLSEEENAENARKRTEKAEAAKVDAAPEVIGVCPCCGTNVVEKDMAYFCDNMECSFAIWKDNKFFQAIGKEMTRDIAEELLGCGTVKLMQCKSRRTGKSFNCYVDITYDDEGRVSYEIRFPKSKFRRE